MRRLATYTADSTRDVSVRPLRNRGCGRHDGKHAPLWLLIEAKMNQHANPFTYLDSMTTDASFSADDEKLSLLQTRMSFARVSKPTSVKLSTSDSLTSLSINRTSVPDKISMTATDVVGRDIMDYDSMDFQVSMIRGTWVSPVKGRYREVVCPLWQKTMKCTNESNHDCAECI